MSREVKARLRRTSMLCLLLAAPATGARGLEVKPPSRGPRRAELTRTAEIANCVLALPAFRRELAGRQSFYNTKDSGEEVLARLDATPSCRLATYRRGGLFGYVMYWDRVDAKHPPKSDVVRFNLNTFREGKWSFLAGTALHECAHVAGYSHRYNDRVRHPEILDSVPYQVGILAERHAQACLDTSSK
ncbi:MAG: hypothetical protein AAFZ18_06060 [Myxococcota bacterium]